MMDGNARCNQATEDALQLAYKTCVSESETLGTLKILLITITMIPKQSLSDKC